MSHLGLAYVLMLRPVSPKLVIFPDFELRASVSTFILLLSCKYLLFIVSKIKDKMWERVESVISDYEGISADEASFKRRSTRFVSL